MALVLPTAESAPTYPAQSYPDATDFVALAGASALTGVVSGCGVTADGTDFTLSVAAGSIQSGGSFATVTAGTVTPAAASTNDRRDIVVASAAGVLSVVEGTPCSVAGWTTASTSLPPVKPAVPSGSVLLAEVYVPGGATLLAAGNLVDKTAIIPPPLVYGLTPTQSGRISIIGVADNGETTVANENVEMCYGVAVARPIVVTSVGLGSSGTADSGAVYRIGLRADTGQTMPGQLLADMGTVPAGAGAVVSVTGSVAVPAGIMWISVTPQNGTNFSTVDSGVPSPAQIIGNMTSVSDYPGGWTLVAMCNQSDVPGALPDTGTYNIAGPGNGWGGAMPLIFVGM